MLLIITTPLGWACSWSANGSIFSTGDADLPATWTGDRSALFSHASTRGSPVCAFACPSISCWAFSLNASSVIYATVAEPTGLIRWYHLLSLLVSLALALHYMTFLVSSSGYTWEFTDTFLKSNSTITSWSRHWKIRCKVWIWSACQWTISSTWLSRCSYQPSCRDWFNDVIIHWKSTGCSLKILPLNVNVIWCN